MSPPLCQPAAALFVVAILSTAFVVRFQQAEAQIPPGGEWVNGEYVPDPNSPLGKGEHPRMVMRRDKIDYYKNKVRTDFKTEYGRMVSWVDGHWDKVIDNEGRSTATMLVGTSGLICLLEEVPGVTYGHPFNEYCTKPIEHMLVVVDRDENSDPNDDVSYSGAGYYTYEILGDMAWGYDTLFEKMTNEERRKVAVWLGKKARKYADADLGKFSRNELFSSPYLNSDVIGARLALAIYGDGYADIDAKYALDTWDDVMLNGGWIDAQNMIARTKGLDSQMSSSYSFWEYGGHFLHLKEWANATNKDYIRDGTEIEGPYLIKNYARGFPYLRIPTRYEEPESSSTRYPHGKYVRLKFGEGTAGAALGSYQVEMLGELLAGIDDNAVALSQWADEKYYPEGKYSTNAGWPIARRHVLWHRKDIAAKSPAEIGLPDSEFFGGIGAAIFTSGLEMDENDIRIAHVAPPYIYGGHSFTGPLSLTNGVFLLAKYGEGLIMNMNANFRNTTIANILRPSSLWFHLKDPDRTYAQKNTHPGSAIRSTYFQPDDNSDPNDDYDLGGMLGFYYDKDQKVHYSFADHYNATRQSASHTRQILYLEPDENTNFDYIIDFTRVASLHDGDRPSRPYHTAFKPTVNAAAVVVSPEITEYGMAREFTFTNKRTDPDPYNGRVYSEPHGLLHGYIHEPKTGFKVVVDDQEENIKNGDAEHWRGAHFIGTHSFDIEDTLEREKTRFLTFLQTADADRPGENDRVTSQHIETDKMTGVFIEASPGQKHAVALFSKEESVIDFGQNSPLTYQVGSDSLSGPVRHVIANVRAGRTYKITDTDMNTNQTTELNVTVNNLRTDHAIARGDELGGLLIFETNLSSLHRFSIHIDGNAAPSVDAGNNQTIQEGETVSLACTASDDGLPASSTMTVQWSKASGPGTVTFSTPTNLQTTATFSADGTYQLRCSASDGELTGSDTVKIVVVGDGGGGGGGNGGGGGENAPPADPEPLKGPAALHLTFDDGTGTTAADAVGGNDGTLVGGPVWTTGKIGGSLQFDGVDDYVDLSTEQIIGNQKTVTLWYKPADENGYKFLIGDGGGGNSGIYYTYTSGLHTLIVQGTASSVSKQDIGKLNQGQWHHLAIVLDGNHEFYVDGGRAGIDGTVTGAFGAGFVGRRGGSFLNGEVDDVCAFDRVLSPGEISWLANGNSCAYPPPGLCLATLLQNRVRKNEDHALDEVAVTITDTATSTAVLNDTFALDANGKLIIEDISALSSGATYDMKIKALGHLSRTLSGETDILVHDAANCLDFGTSLGGDTDGDDDVDLPDLTTGVRHYIQDDSAVLKKTHRTFALGGIVEFIQTFLASRG